MFKYRKSFFATEKNAARDGYVRSKFGVESELMNCFFFQWVKGRSC